MENKLVMVGDKKFPVVDDIRNELIKKYNIDLSTEDDTESLYYNNVFLYTNFIPPNIDKNIFDFLVMSGHLKTYMKYGKLTAVIPYINYGFNFYHKGLIEFEQKKTLSKLIMNSGIDNIITINQEILNFDFFFRFNNVSLKIYNIDIIKDLFKDVFYHDLKQGLFLNHIDYHQSSNHQRFKNCFVLNTFRESYNMELIKDTRQRNFVLFVPYIFEITVIINIINYLKKNGSFPIEIVTLGILPDDYIFDLLNNKFIERVITSDLIPLTVKLQNLNKLTVMPIFDKISDKINEINILTKNSINDKV